MLLPAESDQCSSIRVSPSTPIQLPVIHVRSSRVGSAVESAASAASAAAADSRADSKMAAALATRQYLSDIRFKLLEILLQEARWTRIRDRNSLSSPVCDSVLRTEPEPSQSKLSLPLFELIYPRDASVCHRVTAISTFAAISSAS